MALGNFYLTEAGNALLARAQTGTSLIITRCQAGEGYWAEGVTYANITALAKPVKDMVIAKKKASGSQAEITVQFSSAGVGRKWDWTELCLWAADPDDPTNRAKDFVYGSCRAEDVSEAVPIPAELTEFNFNIFLKVGSATNVTVLIDGSLVYLTSEALEEAMGAVEAEIQTIITEVESRIVEVERQVSETMVPLIGDIQQLDLDLSDLERRVAANEGNIVNINTDLTALHRTDGDLYARVAEVGAQASAVWDAMFNEITENPAILDFDTLEGFALTGGVWNKPLRRLEV